MLKSMGLTLLTLLTSAVGLTLYLPTYTPDAVAAPVYEVMADSLQQPIDGSTYLASNVVLDVAADPPLPAGLQLGLHGSMSDAQAGALQLSLLPVELPMLPTIFKSTLDDREWYVLALGPLPDAGSSFAVETLTQDLQAQGLRVQPILWPGAAPAPAPAAAAAPAASP